MQKEKRTHFLTWFWVICGILSILYGTSVKMIGTGTRFYMVWFAIGAVCFGLAYAAKKHWFTKLPMLLRRMLLVLISIGMICFLVVEGCVISGFQKKGIPNLDYVIVLGAQVRKNGPSGVLKYRLDKAIEYLSENPETTCIVSGGQGYNEPFAEAVGMADYLMENGISEERILLEDESTSTLENILFSKKMMEDDASVGLITNNFHMFRALQCARKYGLTNVCGIAAGTPTLYLPNNMLREFFGEIKFLIS